MVFFIDLYSSVLLRAVPKRYLNTPLSSGLSQDAGGFIYLHLLEFLSLVPVLNSYLGILSGISDCIFHGQKIYAYSG